MTYLFYFNYFKIVFMLLQILVLYLYNYGNDASKHVISLIVLCVFTTFLAQIS